MYNIQALSYAAEPVRVRARGKQFLLVSYLSLEKDANARAVEKLRSISQFSNATGDFSHNPMVVVKLNACDAVALVESVDNTKLSEAKNLIAFAEQCGKPLISFVAV